MLGGFPYKTLQIAHVIYLHALLQKSNWIIACVKKWLSVPIYYYAIEFKYRKIETSLSKLSA